jgi:putative transcriptional regulator
LHQQASPAALAKGRFLVASRHLHEANFAETVVLLVDYDHKGAMGLIINRPTTVRLATILPTIAALQQRPDTVSIGGPVASNRLVLLIRSNSQPTDAERVLEHVYVSMRRQVLERMVDTPDAGAHFRVYAGYAGWRAGQLEREVSRGDWHIVPADAETVFDKAPADIWPALIQKSSIRWLSF